MSERARPAASGTRARRAASRSRPAGARRAARAIRPGRGRWRRSARARPPRPAVSCASRCSIRAPRRAAPSTRLVADRLQAVLGDRRQEHHVARAGDQAPPRAGEVHRERARLHVEQLLVVARVGLRLAARGSVTLRAADPLVAVEERDEDRQRRIRALRTVCSHVERGRCCMSSGPFVARAGGHSRGRRGATGTPRCGRACRSASPARRSYHCPRRALVGSSASTRRCASHPGPTRGSRPRVLADVVGDVVGERRDVRRIARLDLDHVGRVRIAESRASRAGT